MNTINPNVEMFINSYSEKLWNRLVKTVPYSSEPLRYALMTHNGFVAAFEVLFDREPSKAEIDVFKLNVYEREHTYLSSQGSDALGFRYHADKPNRYLVNLRKKVGKLDTSTSCRAW